MRYMYTMVLTVPHGLCREAEQVSRCVCIWGAPVGDVDRAAALERPRSDASHLSSDTAQEEASVPS